MEAVKKFRRKKYSLPFILMGLCLCTYGFLKSINSHRSKSKTDISYVVVHIDLKRTPLKLEYLRQLLLTLKNHGVNGLLMEYEDMFPYEGKLINITSKNCYTKDELKQFLTVSNELGIEIIPLVQTFGHMEYVLKLEEFQHLREDSAHADSICPSKLESLNLIENMLTQVIKFHKAVIPIKHIHIGCDEVYQINKCKQCITRGLNTLNIYIEHIRVVTDIVKTLSTDSIVLVWDDMLGTVSPKDWNYQLNISVEPVYWDYSKEVSVSHTNLMKYHKTFPNIWIATAFKGADGIENVLPNIKNRFYNHYSWLQAIHNYKFGGEKKVFNFKGIILTGWSRYSHFTAICDILPASIPSLLLNLLLIAEFKAGIDIKISKDQSAFYSMYLEKRFKKALKCRKIHFDLKNRKELIYFDSMHLDNCNFNEWEIYKSLKKYLELYSIIIGASNENYWIKYTNNDWCSQIWNKISELKLKLLNGLSRYYAPDFVKDYIHNIIKNLRKPFLDICPLYVLQDLILSS